MAVFYFSAINAEIFLLKETNIFIFGENYVKLICDDIRLGKAKN